MVERHNTDSLNAGSTDSHEGVANTDFDFGAAFNQLWSGYADLASLVSLRALLLSGPDGLELGIPDGKATTEALRCEKDLTEDDAARILVISQQLGLTMRQASAYLLAAEEYERFLKEKKQAIKDSMVRENDSEPEEDRLTEQEAEWAIEEMVRQTALTATSLKKYRQTLEPSAVPERRIMHWAVHPIETSSESTASQSGVIVPMTGAKSELSTMIRERRERRRKRKEAGNVADFETILQSIDNTLAQMTLHAESAVLTGSVAASEPAVSDKADQASQ